MKVNIYKIGGAEVAVKSVDAMFSGVSTDTDVNIELIDILAGAQPVYHPADIHIMYGTYKPMLGTPSTKIKCMIIAGCWQNQTKFIQMETPIIGRLPNDNPNDIKTWPAGFRVGIGHVCNHYGEFGIPEDPDNKRWSRMSKKLKIKLKPWRKTGDYILIPLQMPFDAAMMGINMWDWATEMITRVRSVTDMPIAIKIHPKLREGSFHKKEMNNFIKFLKTINDVDILPQKTSAIASLSNAWCVISYTSGFSVDAIQHGVPVITTSKGNFVYDISSHEPEDVLDPELGDRLNWFRRYSYAQWSLNELANGKAWKHIKRFI